MPVINGDNLPVPSSDEARITPILVCSVFITAFGSSAQFGFNIGVLNNLETAIRSSFNNSDSSFVISDDFTEVEWATAVSIFAIGGMIGSLLAGMFADLIGRKWSMMSNNILAFIAVCLQAFAVHPIMLIIGRFVIGINAGANTVLAPLYITEISPFKYRGTMGVFHQLAITITILLSQLLGMHELFGRTDSLYLWRILLALPLVFVIIQVLVLPFCYESPRYLFIKKDKSEEAEKALKKLCGSRGYQSELNALEEESMNTETHSVLDTLKSFIIDAGLRRAILVSIALHLSQQITGIGSILLYSTDIFDKAGISNSDIITTIVGVTLLVGTILTIFLIERCGRRTLMLYGLGGMCVFYGLLSATLCFQYVFYNHIEGFTPTSILLILFVIGIVFAFSLGPGVIPWLIVGEFFQQTTRPTAISIATIINWLSNFVVGFIFPFMLKYLMPYAFIAFIFICGLFWLFNYFYLPETKNKTVDDITNDFKRAVNKPIIRCCCTQSYSQITIDEEDNNIITIIN